MSDADRVAALLAVDPVGLGGVSLRSAAGPARDGWLARLVAWLPAGTPLRRVPLHVGDDRLLGGLDLAATLRAGRPVAQRGLLAEADGGLLVLAMAERLPASTAASIAAALDTGELLLERDGLGQRVPSRIGVVALDEGIDDDERLPQRLLERLAFHLQLAPGLASGGTEAAAPPTIDRAGVQAARELLAAVPVEVPVEETEIVEALCAAALALGVASVRAPLLALRAARASAALDGRSRIGSADAALAAGLVLGPRATRLPSSVPDASEPQPADADAQHTDPPAAGDPSETEPAAAEPPDQADPPADDDHDNNDDHGAVDDVVLEAALAAIAPNLLAALKLGEPPGGAARQRAPTSGRAGMSQAGALRGRPAGVRRGEPRRGTRLNLIETLRAAAPWQTLRRQENQADPAAPAAAAPRILIRRDDFHVTRFRQRSATTTIFVVDASGSAALHRLAEAKGAVELLLADCYVRRDSVAVIAFRGRAAELLLAPTRSLVRAKRSLAGLPGGGGTPLAAGIDAAVALADAVRRRGATPVVVLLTDGRANVARDGSPGRAGAAADALAAARQMRQAGLAALLLDTSPQPQEAARLLATGMGATYLPLPHADAASMSKAVRGASNAHAAPRARNA